MNNNHSVLSAIARKHLGIDTLVPRNSDAFDFHDVSVWTLRDALAAAFEAGHAQAAGDLLQLVNSEPVTAVGPLTRLTRSLLLIETAHNWLVPLHQPAAKACEHLATALDSVRSLERGFPASLERD